MLSLFTPCSIRQHGTLLRPLLRGVVDTPFYIAEDVNKGPIDDVLLSDLSWQTLINMKPIRELGVFQPVKDPKKKFLFVVKETLRTLAMLPVQSRSYNGPTTTLWVPFVVDTGSGRTYFNKATMSVLRMNEPNVVTLVDGVPVDLHESGSHFEDINLLGTDVLGRGVLHIDYPARQTTFNVTAPSTPSSNIFWVNLDGGDFFQAFALQNNVDALKKAVKQEQSPKLDYMAASDLIVTNKMDEPSPTWLDIVANKLDPELELVPGQKYSVHTPKE